MRTADGVRPRSLRLLFMSAWVKVFLEMYVKEIRRWVSDLS